MKAIASVILIGLVSGCTDPKQEVPLANSPNSLPAISRDVPSPTEDIVMLPLPWPQTRIGNDDALAKARTAFLGAGLVGINETKFTPSLGRWKERLVWHVRWVTGQVQIAASGGSITLDAETGEVLNIWQSPMRTR